MMAAVAMLVGALLLLGLVMLSQRAALRIYRERYVGIEDLDQEIAARRAKLAQHQHAMALEVARLDSEQRRVGDELSSARTQVQGEAAATRQRAAADADTMRREAAADAETMRREAAAESAATCSSAASAVEALNLRLRELQAQYAAARSTYDQLSSELARVEQQADDLSCGLYEPVYSFQSTEVYRLELTRVRDRQKVAVRDGLAIEHGIAWTIGSDRKAGERMQKQYGKLILRAFNGECDAAIAKVAWNNAPRMIERITSAFSSINKLGEMMQISLTARYLDLKLAELRLEHEYEQKRRDEQEEQRAIRERQREEEKVQAELERARKEAEQEEQRSQRALAKARNELAKAHGDEVGELQARIAEIESELAEAQQRKDRAISLAQQTRAGHVYIISNIGSFGETVYKIGMTRRAQPQDRVDELGDASVPFQFDVHAMIRTEDAPALEAMFHKEFHARRVNLVNMRREFFHVTLDELEAFAAQRNIEMKLTKVAEAAQYRQSLELRSKANTPAPRPIARNPRIAAGTFPVSL